MYRYKTGQKKMGLFYGEILARANAASTKTKEGNFNFDIRKPGPVRNGGMGKKKGLGVEGETKMPPITLPIRSQLQWKAGAGGQSVREGRKGVTGFGWPKVARKLPAVA